MTPRWRSTALSFAKPARIVTGEPLVTIAIPAYNARFFAAALDSALAQTYANLEIVIRDDSRDDAIESIVRSRQPRVPLRYARNPSRLGVRANYVECFEQADGAFVKFLCDDDVLAPDCVARLMRGVPDACRTSRSRRRDATRIDAGAALLPDQPATMPIVDADKVISGVSLANAMLMVGLNMIGEPSTVLFRKSDLEDQRPAFFNFDGAYGHGVIDMVMWTALLLKGDAVYLARAAERIPHSPRSAPARSGARKTHHRQHQGAPGGLACARAPSPAPAAHAVDAAVSRASRERLDRSAGAVVQAAGAVKQGAIGMLRLSVHADRYGPGRDA